MTEILRFKQIVKTKKHMTKNPKKGLIRLNSTC